LNDLDLSDDKLKEIIKAMFRAEQSIMIFRALQIAGYEN
jgi:hypothetical protein|tara:strand:- start:102 stop:218 length:117 start_codon:yes stop_codon:yes gene_type:complete